jgi:molecular chaperone DnaJ
MSKRDFYEILGVNRDASRRRDQEGLPQAGHEAPPGPKSGQSGSRGKIQGRQGGLRNSLGPQKRAAYDQYGHAGVSTNRPAWVGALVVVDGRWWFSDAFGGIFDEIFGGRGGGGGGGRSNIYRGADLRYNLEITLEQAAHGTETKIRIPTMEVCEHCHGSGAKPGTQPKTCPTCNGSGQVRLQQGFFSIQQTCPKCHGTGRIIPSPARLPRRRPPQATQDAGGQDSSRGR